MDPFAAKYTKYINKLGKGATTSVDLTPVGAATTTSTVDACAKECDDAALCTAFNYNDDPPKIPSPLQALSLDEKKVTLTNPTASNYKNSDDNYHPRNAIDGNKINKFETHGKTSDEWWKSEFEVGIVTRVVVTSRNS